MTEEEPEKKDNFWRWYVPFLAIIGICLVLGSFIAVWQNAIEKDYLSRLTPEERAEIQAQEEAEQLEKKEQAREFAESIRNLFDWKVPFWMVIIMLAGTLLAFIMTRGF